MAACSIISLASVSISKLRRALIWYSDRTPAQRTLSERTTLWPLFPKRQWIFCIAAWVFLQKQCSVLIYQTWYTNFVEGTSRESVKHQQTGMKSRYTAQLPCYLFFERMLLPDIAGPAYNVVPIFNSNQICAMLSAYFFFSLGSYARLVEDMGEGIFKRCACVLLKS